MRSRSTSSTSPLPPLPAVHVPPAVHPPSTHRPPTVHPPCHPPRHAPTVLESEVVPATTFRLAGAYNRLLDGKRISSYGVNDPSIYIFYRCPRHPSWRRM